MTTSPFNKAAAITDDNEKQDDLDRLALEEIMKETNRARERAETIGPMGWVKCPLQPTNKRFFRNILMETVADSRRGSKTKNDSKESKESSSNASSAGWNSSELNREKLNKCLKASSPERNVPSKTDSGSLNEKLSKDEQYKNTLKLNRKKPLNTSKRDIEPNEKCTSSRKHRTHHKSKYKYKRKKSM